MTSITLRDYQDAAVDSVFKYFEDKDTPGNPLVALPTGTGKSLAMASFIMRAIQAYPATRAICVTHVKELIEQDYKALKSLWPTAPAGIYSSGLKKREIHYPITFAGIGSIHRRTQQFGHVDLILIDEAHLVGDKDSAMYVKFIAAMKVINPKIKVVGFTATAFRVGMGLLTNGIIFDDICFDLTNLRGFNWLLAEGYLKPLIPQPTELEYDISGVSVQNTGEYNLGELQDAMDKDDLNVSAVREIITKAQNRKHWLVFTSGVDHAKHIAELFVQHGVRAVAIHSKMTDAERDDAIAGFKAGIYQCAVNNNILTTGFDFPEIDLIAVLRPTKSAGLWVQMLGRGTRPVFATGYDLTLTFGRLEAIKNGGAPNCLVLDFARNTIKLGPINDPLMPKQRGDIKGPGVAPIKECPQCGTYNHASATICINCGCHMPRHLKIVAESGTAALIKTEMIQPKIEQFKVTKLTYQRHLKTGMPDSLKVSYYCGLRRFEEYILLEHIGPVQRRAHNWWKARTDLPVPETVDDALQVIGHLVVPHTISVRTDTKWPDITDYYGLRSESQNVANAPSQGNRTA